MSMFYILLCIFIGILVLLCAISCCMYICHICGDGIFEGTSRLYSEKYVYRAEEQQLLNQVNQTEQGQGVELQAVQVKIQQSQNIYNAAPFHAKQSTSGHSHPIQPAVQTRIQGYEQQSETYSAPVDVFHKPQAMLPNVALRERDVVSKPAIAVKPTIHSQPSSKRNSLVKPSVPPPPPPSNASAPVSPRNSLIRTNSTKRKAPPPPIPVTGLVLAVPPSYQKVMTTVIYDTPMTDNYLSDS